MRALVIGLLGGVAAGKSTVARLLEARGAHRIDADALARDELGRPKIVAGVLQELGPTLARADGSLDRSVLAALVFADPDARRRLEDLLHPAILARVRRTLEKLRPRGGWIVLDAPLLLESGLDRECDVLIFVEAAPKTREERALERGWPPGDRSRREKCQTPMKTKRALADYVLQNNGSLEETKVRLETIMLEVSKGGAGRRD